MTDSMSVAERSARMALIAGSGNETTEMAMVRLLRENGITGWRRHQRLTWRISSLPRSLQAQQRVNRFRGSVAPDFVFSSRRTVLFVDGCFWHGCPMHGTSPASNSRFWAEKFSRNRLRDRFVDRALCQLGWTVLRVWEHELKLRPPWRLSRWLVRHLATVC
jgi:DNA mismatch endonuclease (patch repair protein)